METSKVKMRLGADPEYLLLQGGKPKAVCGLIGADKWNPHQYEDMPEGYTVQEDNVAVEFGIPPASSAEEYIKHIKAVQAKFLATNKHLKFNKLSCILYPSEELKHPGASIWGCEPDFNAWTGEVNPKPKAPSPLLRSAGGHIHVETKQDPREVIKAMDVYLGIPSVLMDTGEMRKQLYGKAGAFRPKPYGAEYRTLSNFWTFEDKYIKWVWDNTQRALNFLENGGDVSYLQEEVERCINDNDKELAKCLCDELVLEVV
jgi:hypothetical protein